MGKRCARSAIGVAITAGFRGRQHCQRENRESPQGAPHEHHQPDPTAAGNAQSLPLDVVQRCRALLRCLAGHALIPGKPLLLDVVQRCGALLRRLVGEVLIAGKALLLHIVERG